MKVKLASFAAFFTTLAVFILTFADAAEPADISAFALKDGSVYKGGAELDCEVNEVPSDIEGAIRYWCAFGPDANDSVTEDETGVWFFTSSGASLTFVPLESEYECQDVVFSPDGGKFVLVTGGGMRPDVSFEVYGEGTEKLEEFDGIRGALAWIDPVRFVFTRLDDTRDIGDDYAGGFLSQMGALRVSVVMYDAAVGEAVVLKEATDTQNFWLGEVIEDGAAVTVSEDFVKSAKDWKDEDKIGTREIRVEIPAAG